MNSSNTWKSQKQTPASEGARLVRSPVVPSATTAYRTERQAPGSRSRANEYPHGRRLEEDHPRPGIVTGFLRHPLRRRSLPGAPQRRNAPHAGEVRGIAHLAADSCQYYHRGPCEVNQYEIRKPPSTYGGNRPENQDTKKLGKSYTRRPRCSFPEGYRKPDSAWKRLKVNT